MNDVYARAMAQQLTTQLAEIVQQKFNKFLDRLKNKDIKKIRLIGDSITAGVNGTSYSVPTTNRIILTQTNTVPVYEASTTSVSWANMFRQYINNFDPTIDFFNCGIGGWSTLTFQPYWDQIIKPNEDVVFVMLGTNDRQYPLADYKQRITDFLAYVNSHCNTMIVMCAPPSQSDFNADGTYQYVFGTKEIDNILYDLCRTNGYPYISHYKDMLDYCYKSNVDISYLMESAGSHPNDNGYAFMWKNIQNKLNFVDTSLNWRTKDQSRDINIKSESQISTYMDMNMDKFQLGTNLWIISSTKCTDLGIPSAGLLVTHIVSKDSYYQKYNTQIFYAFQSGKVYARGYTDTGWYTTWRDPETAAAFALTPHHLATALITDYAVGLNYATVTTSEAPTYNMPEGKGGLLVTLRAKTTGDGYSKQIYYPYGTGTQYVRSYISSSWSTWQGSGSLYEDKRFPIDEPITSYGQMQVSYSVYTVADATAPESKGGVLVTTRTNRDVYSYQEYWIYASTTKYRRYWTGSAWSAWTKITTP